MSLPEYMTPAEVAKLLHMEEEEIREKMARGNLRTQDDKILRADVEGLLVLQAMAPEPFEHTEGSTRKPTTKSCRGCGKIGQVHYLGSEVLEGSLEWVHVVHTEVDNQFGCDGCGATWTEFKML